MASRPWHKRKLQDPEDGRCIIAEPQFRIGTSGRSAGGHDFRDRSALAPPSASSTRSPFTSTSANMQGNSRRNSADGRFKDSLAGEEHVSRLAGVERFDRHDNSICVPEVGNSVVGRALWLYQDQWASTGTGYRIHSSLQAVSCGLSIWSASRPASRFCLIFVLRHLERPYRVRSSDVVSGTSTDCSNYVCG